MLFTNDGTCPCCAQRVRFEARGEWLRDEYVCPVCHSIPRERALFWVIEHFYPQWRDLRIHETSPVFRGGSARLLAECRGYVPTQFFPEVTPGELNRGVRCENLEALTFPDGSIDLHISQDVMEHVFDPEAAFREIARTLAPGGAHIFTTPLVEKAKPSIVCASIDSDGRIAHHRPPEYHGNPISEDGSLVTRRWGYDITDVVAATCGLHTTIIYIDALDCGIRAEYIEVLLTRQRSS